MSQNKLFHTDFKFTDRTTKANYVWLKYGSILKGRILDVGADECHLKTYLPVNTQYIGIGLGGNPDIQVNLEGGKIPFEDKSFDCVLCLDVLEHLESIHAIFDEICRVSRSWAIIALPNAWNTMYNMLKGDVYKPDQPFKFYGLPVEPPQDRHKWFFSYDEAEQFIRYRAQKCNFSVIQIEPYEIGSDGTGQQATTKEKARSELFYKDLDTKNLYYGTMWCVLQRKA